MATLWATVKPEVATPSFTSNGPILRLPLLRPDQSVIARHPAKIKCVVMGRRWGKTVLGGTVSLACASQGARVAWIVPTYRNGRPLWKWAESLVAPLRAHRQAKVNRAERLIEFGSSGFLGIYSADSPDSIRGDAFHIVVVDEAARITEDTWQAVIQPTLADYDGRAFLISTPRGRDWFYREYQRGQANKRERQRYEEQWSWNAPTSQNPNPKIKTAYEQAKTRVSSRTFQQEWDAQFVDFEGAVFRLVEELSILSPHEPSIHTHPHAQYVAGIDWGKLNDFTVLSVFDLTTGEQVFIDRFNTVDYSVQLGRLEAAHRRFHFRKILAEANTMGEPLIEQCYRRGMPIEGLVTTNASKAVWVDDFNLAMESREVKLLNNPEQKDEFLNFEGTRLPSGLTRYAAPEGLHDDTVIAALLAYQAVKIPPASGATEDSANIDISRYNSNRETRTGLTTRRRR